MGILMLFVCGFLLGGTYSLAKRRHFGAAGLIGLAAVMAAVAAVVWLRPGQG